VSWMAVQHRKIETGIERFCNLPVIRIKAGSIAELNCREAAYLNHFLHLTGVPLRYTPSGEKNVRRIRPRESRCE
jgi:hypothetical protein